MSISELAQLNGVSDATVFKFTKLIGYEGGYMDFTKDVQKSLHNKLLTSPEIKLTDKMSFHEKIMAKEIKKNWNLSQQAFQKRISTNAWINW